MVRHLNPNKLNKQAHSAVMSPLIAALVAFRLGRATQEHYHDLAGAFLIAQNVIEITPRHRHLIVELDPSIEAMNAVFNRAQQRTVTDAWWSATAAEVDLIEQGITIYEALIKATPGVTMRRAINRIRSKN